MSGNTASAGAPPGGAPLGPSVSRSSALSSRGLDMCTATAHTRPLSTAHYYISTAHYHISTADGALHAPSHEECGTFWVSHRRYNILKVARHLFGWSANASLADFYERAILNGIVGNQARAIHTCPPPAPYLHGACIMPTRHSPA